MHTVAEWITAHGNADSAQKLCGPDAGPRLQGFFDAVVRVIAHGLALIEGHHLPARGVAVVDAGAPTTAGGVPVHNETIAWCIRPAWQGLVRTLQSSCPRVAAAACVCLLEWLQRTARDGMPAWGSMPWCSLSAHYSDGWTTCTPISAATKLARRCHTAAVELRRVLQPLYQRVCTPAQRHDDNTGGADEQAMDTGGRLATSMMLLWSLLEWPLRHKVDGHAPVCPTIRHWCDAMQRIVAELRDIAPSAVQAEAAAIRNAGGGAEAAAAREASGHRIATSLSALCGRFGELATAVSVFSHTSATVLGQPTSTSSSHGACRSAWLGLGLSSDVVLPWDALAPKELLYVSGPHEPQEVQVLAVSWDGSVFVDSAAPESLSAAHDVGDSGGDSDDNSDHTPTRTPGAARFTHAWRGVPPPNQPDTSLKAVPATHLLPMATWDDGGRSTLFASVVVAELCGPLAFNSWDHAGSGGVVPALVTSLDPRALAVSGDLRESFRQLVVPTACAVVSLLLARPCQPRGYDEWLQHGAVANLFRLAAFYPLPSSDDGGLQQTSSRFTLLDHATCALWHLARGCYRVNATDAEVAARAVFEHSARIAWLPQLVAFLRCYHGVLPSHTRRARGVHKGPVRRRRRSLSTEPAVVDPLGAARCQQLSAGLAAHNHAALQSLVASSFGLLSTLCNERDTVMALCRSDGPAVVLSTAQSIVAQIRVSDGHPSDADSPPITGQFVCVCAWHVVLCLLCMCHGLTRVWHVVLATTSTQPPMNQLRCIPLVKVDYLNARLQPGGQCLHHFRIAVALLHVW